MHCDEVFEALTASVPVRHPDLLAHLNRCPRCRDLDEALAPLRAGFDFDPPRAAPLNIERTPSSLALGLATDAAERLRAGSQLRTTRLAPLATWRYVAAFLAGAAASLAAAAVIPVESSPSAASLASNCLWTNRSSTDLQSGELVQTCVACHLPTK